MITPGQKYFLEALIGPQGQITQAIKSFTGCYLSTKILYLKRSTHLQGEDFLVSIDKLFIPNLDEEHFKNFIEFTHMLKLINDLCFNNLIDYHDQHARPALHCYFGNEPIDSDTIQKTIESMVQQRITEILNTSSATIFLEIHLRMSLEKDIQANREWRAYSNLPGNQRPLLDPRPPRNPQSDLFPILENQPNAMEEFQQLPDYLELELSTKLQILKEFKPFQQLLKAQIQLKDFTRLSTKEREYLLEKAASINTFLACMKCSPKMFMRLPFEKKQFYINAFEGINVLIYQISTRESPIKEELNLHLKAVYHFCYILNFPLELQLNLPFPFRQLIYTHFDKINQLVISFKIPLANIIGLAYEPLELVLSNFDSLSNLFHRKTIEFNQFIQLKLEQMKDLLSHSEAYIELTQARHFTLQQLLDSANTTRNLLLTYPSEAIYLISNDKATVNEMLDLPVAHLQEALTHPYDDEDLELIIPSTYNCIIL